MHFAVSVQIFIWSGKSKLERQNSRIALEGEFNIDSTPCGDLAEQPR